jgi:hypothetical protein
MKSLGGLSLKMLQRGKCLGVFVGRFGEFLLGRGSGVSESTSRASWAALEGGGDSMFADREGGMENKVKEGNRRARWICLLFGNY